jgi:hypothetical protein
VLPHPACEQTNHGGVAIAPGVGRVGLTRTERAKADEINRLDFHFGGPRWVGCPARIRDVAAPL